MKRMIRLNQIFRSRKIVLGTILNVPVFVGGVVGDFPIFFSTSNTKWGRAWIFLPLFLRVQPGQLLFYSNLENPVLTDNFSRGFMLGFLSSYLRELADGFLEEQIGDKIKNNFEKSHRTFMKILLKTFIKHADKLY